MYLVSSNTFSLVPGTKPPLSPMRKLTPIPPSAPPSLKSAHAQSIEILFEDEGEDGTEVWPPAHRWEATPLWEAVSSLLASLVIFDEIQKTFLRRRVVSCLVLCGMSQALHCTGSGKAFQSVGSRKDPTVPFHSTMSGKGRTVPIHCTGFSKDLTFISEAMDSRNKRDSPFALTVS